MKTTSAEQRAVLAFIAAHGLLHGDEHNKSVSIRQIHEKFPSGNREEIARLLKILVDGGLLRHWNTGHYGYGDHWVDGTDTYTVTDNGMMSLWEAFV